jgi:tripartite-type tricarboxylate transporter receptor subunit TctC
MSNPSSLNRRQFSVAAGLSLGSGLSWGQTPAYPSKTVSLVVPFPPGGAVDQAGRAISQALFKVWKQPVVISTKAGAGGAIGMSTVANAPADGYTLLATHPSIIAVPEAERMFDRNPPVDRSNFAPLGLLVADPLVLVVKADSPWKTYDEFIADAKRRPDMIAYSSSGAYSAVHLPIEMLTHAAGIKLRHIPYSGGGPALTAVLGGVVAATAGAPAVLAPQIKAGELRALVTTGTKRHALLPDTPTAIELGFKDVEFYLWVGLFASAKTDEALTRLIRRDIGRAVQEPEFVQLMNKLGAPIDYRDGPAFTAFLDKDEERIKAAIKRIGKVD